MVVLKKTNQKLKIADAWTAATKIFNNIWATSFNKTVIRKKYSSVVAKKWLGAVMIRENRQKAKTLSEFRRINSGTGGGSGIEPPDVDGEDESDENLLPILQPAHLQAYFNFLVLIQGTKEIKLFFVTFFKMH